MKQAYYAATLAGRSNLRAFSATSLPTTRMISIPASVGRGSNEAA